MQMLMQSEPETYLVLVTVQISSATPDLLLIQF